MLGFTLNVLQLLQVIFLKILLQVIYSAFDVVSIATGCIYTEAKNYPREPAAHVAISEFADLLLLLYSFTMDGI